jgi:hypothetical protein
MSAPALFGLEYECSLGSDHPGGRVDHGRAFHQLCQAVCEQSPWLSDGGSGLYTPLFRLYLDTGGHAEAALVECDSPDAYLAVKHAAFHLLGRAVRRAREAEPGLVLLANNHDYLIESVFGCHESYGIVKPPDTLARGMLPFLASRPLIAGNGRIDSRGRVLLSSRAEAMVLETGGDTTAQRALFSTARNEPLMTQGPFRHRLHLICGDALIGPLGDWLKVGTTALVLAWLQDEPAGADDLTVPDPLSLLRSANILWEPPGRLKLFRPALDLQDAYCERVGRYVSQRDLPEWCAQVVVLWRDALDRLRRDPFSLADRLDPFFKLSLFDDALGELGKSWSAVAGDRSLYHKLALLDVSCHQVGEASPYGEAQAGVEGRPVPVETDPLTVAAALTTRAAARARLIAEHSGQSGVVCNWDSVRGYDAVHASMPDPTRPTAHLCAYPPRPVPPPAASAACEGEPPIGAERRALLDRLVRVLTEPLGQPRR